MRATKLAKAEAALEQREKALAAKEKDVAKGVSGRGVLLVIRGAYSDL